MTLLDPQDVRDLLPQEDFTDEQLAVAMRLVASWLKKAAGLPALPNNLADDDDLFGPALELVALIGENPTSLASRTAGPTSRSWPLAARRDAILAEVKRSAGGPRGSFPPAEPWPDPARSGASWYDPAHRTWWS